MPSILIIDDSRDIRVLMQKLLERAGYQVVAVESTDSGLAEIRRNSPDLVLLDLEMPVKDGAECLSAIRSDPKLRGTPVFLVTGTPLREVILRVAKLGVSGIVIKSGNWAPDLISRVSKHFATQETLAPKDAGIEPKLPASIPVALASAQGKVPAAGSHAEVPPAVVTHKQTLSTAKTSNVLKDLPAWNAPIIPEVQGEMTDERALEVLKSLTPIITRSELLETMLAETVNVRALRPAAHQVLRLTKSPDASVQTLANAIRQDQALSLRLLKMANSTLYSHGEHVDSVVKAVSRIGLTQIHSVVLTVGVLDAFSGVPVSGNFRPDWFWEHATACGLLAMRIAQASGRPKEFCDTLFTTGLLHDLGRLLYIEHLPDHYHKVVEIAEQLELPLETIESRLLLLNHADITDRLLRHWKFPPSMILPVAYHHLSMGNLSTTAPRAANDVVPLALANRLAHAMVLGTSGNEVIYSIKDFIDHLRMPAGKISEICSKARYEIADLRLNMQMHAGASVENYVDSVRKTIGEVRPRALSTRPDVDPVALMVEALWGPVPTEDPNLLTLHITDPRERVAALRLLDQATATLQPGDASDPLPVLVVGETRACLFAPSQLPKREIRQVTLPRNLNRLLRDMQALVPGEQAKV